LPGVVVALALLLFDLKVLANHGWNPRAFIFEDLPILPIIPGAEAPVTTASSRMPLQLIRWTPKINSISRLSLPAHRVPTFGADAGTGESFEGIRYLTDPASKFIVGMWVLAPVAMVGLWAAWDTWRDPTSIRGRDALLVLTQAIFIALVPKPTWEDPLAILRVGPGLLAALLIWMATLHRRALLLAVAWWASSGLALILAAGMW
jgi:hypothetical protein